MYCPHPCMAGWREEGGGLGAHWVSPDPAAAASVPALSTAPAGLAALPGRQRQAGDASRLRSGGLFPVSIYANEGRFRSTELS